MAEEIPDRARHYHRVAGIQDAVRVLKRHDDEVGGDPILRSLILQLNGLVAQVTTTPIDGMKFIKQAE